MKDFYWQCGPGPNRSGRAERLVFISGSNALLLHPLALRVPRWGAVGLPPVQESGSVPIDIGRKVFFGWRVAPDSSGSRRAVTAQTGGGNGGAGGDDGGEMTCGRLDWRPWRLSRRFRMVFPKWEGQCAPVCRELQKGYFRMVLNWTSETEGRRVSRRVSGRAPTGAPTSGAGPEGILHSREPAARGTGVTGFRGPPRLALRGPSAPACAILLPSPGIPAAGMARSQPPKVLWNTRRLRNGPPRTPPGGATRCPLTDQYERT